MTKNNTCKAIIFALTFLLCSDSLFSQNSIVRTIYFKSNSFSIDKRYHRALNLIVRQLNSDTFAYLKVFGYSDTKGPDTYNESLSEKRATAVFNFLSSHTRLDSSKVYVTWIGEAGQDVAYDLHFPQAHIQQRCVDIWVMFKK